MAKGRSGSMPSGGLKVPEAGSSGLQGLPQDQMPTIRLIPHQDPRSNRPSLSFPSTSRTLPHEDCVIRVGRYSERDINPNPAPHTPSSAPVGFKSKVVSRRHCEFWCSQGQWYIKDVKSSSGTFLNHIRLSQPSMESRPWPVNDGDVVQLGIDFRGGEEMIFRCVKIRVECNRGWQKTLNAYNVTTHKRLRDLGKAGLKKDSDAASVHSSECAICLMSIAPCQSLFVAPCSHVWHYKCIRPILNNPTTFPQFLCPNCRAVTDLEADVDDPAEDWEHEETAAGLALENSIGHVSPALEATGGAVSEHQKTPEFGIIGSISDTAGRLIQEMRLANSASSEMDLTSGSNSSPSLFAVRSAPQPSPPFPETSAEPTARTASDSFQFLRPITPTRPLMSNGELDEAQSHAATADMLIANGPMTPTNNAGPFVFDGSAGRAERTEARITSPGMADTTMSGV